MSTPAISVVIPVYNGADYLRATIASVCAQTLTPREIILVDDGSTDSTEQIGRTQPGVRYIRQARAGAGAARNHGVAIATGEFIAFIDADDLWQPQKLFLQARALQTQPAPDFIFSWIEEFITPDLAPAEAEKLQPRLEPLTGPSCITLLIKKHLFIQTGGFPRDLQLGEFIAWYGLCLDQGLKPLVLPQVLARRRLHANNQGRSNHHHRSQFAWIAKQALERKRHSSV